VTTSVVEKVRRIIDETKARGEEPPGRPTLIKLTGATDHQVKVALATLATAGETAPPATASEPAEPEPLGDEDPAGLSVSNPVSRDFPAGLAVAGDVAGGAGASVGGPGDRAGDAGDSRVTHGAKGGKFVASLGFVLGSLFSVAANVLAARIPAKDAPADWTPPLDAQVGAVAWPLMLIIAVEVLSRIPWPPGALWKLARYGGVGTVALVGAVISYGHIHEVLLLWRYSPIGASVGPLGVDGLMVVCGFAMLATSGASVTSAGDAGGILAPATARAGDPR
jgi:hypothetical protein